MNLQGKIESILFVAGKPLAVKKLAAVLGAKAGFVAAGLEQLAAKYNGPESGVVLLQAGEERQLVSNPENRRFAEQFVKAEIAGELTRPQLETLTVISYCGPITKPELEQIRGVNCGLIIRNLLMRGLIAETEGATELLPSYTVTADYLRYLGVASVRELPDYAELHRHEYIVKTLETPPA